MEKYCELTGSKEEQSLFLILYAPGDANEPVKGRAWLHEMAHEVMRNRRDLAFGAQYFPDVVRTAAAICHDR